MRAMLVEGLNRELEIDHDAIEEAFMKPVKLSEQSPYVSHKCAVRFECASYMSRLDLLGIVAGGGPIVAVYEGGIIQRFE